MNKHFISFTKPKSQVESKEYTSKSELINDLVEQARKQQRQVDWIRTKLEKAEKSGYTDDSKEQILLQSLALHKGTI